MAKTWTPTETQTLFLAALKGADGNQLTLAQASKVIGKTIASGAVNALMIKGLVQTEKVVCDCEVVRKDTREVVGSTKKNVTIYKLVAATADGTAK